MNKDFFLKELVDELELESQIDLETDFKSLPEWDSLNVMVLIGYVSKKFDFSLNAVDMEKITTFQDLINAIGVEKFND